MEKGKLFREIVNVIAEDEHVIKGLREFVEELRIPWTIVNPLIERYEFGQKDPYDPIDKILSEWIQIQGGSATVAKLREILKECEFVACAEKIKKLKEVYPHDKLQLLKPLEEMRSGPSRLITRDNFPEESSSRNSPRFTPITFGLKSVVQNFTGREKELGRLNEYFHSKECPIVLISGLGGIGKTELVKKFTQDISDPSRNGQIVKCWLSGENAQSLLNSTSQFCHQLQLPSKGADGQPLGIQEMIQNIMKKLKSKEEFGRWVIIIDNVDDIHPEFETTVQTLSEFGPDAFLLVTSRRRDIYEGELRLLEVKEMQLENSMEFVRKSLEITITDNSSDDPIKSLCEILGNFPLALNQASAFIRQQQIATLKGRAYKIENYLEELAKTETLGLDKDKQLGYSTATLKVWVITINKIRECYGADGYIALDLLDSMAFINPDGIPIPFMHKLYHKFYNIQEIPLNQIEDSLTLLLKYSMISSDDEVMAIHRLVQLSSRDRMSSKSPAEDGQSSKAVEMLSKFWTSFGVEKWNRIEMRNILTIWNHTPLQKELNALRAAKQLTVQTELHILGMVNEEYDFIFERCKFLREQDAESCNMEFSLAVAMKAKGQYESALQKFTSLYSKYTELYGAEDKNTLAAGHLIAGVLCDLQRYEESLEWAEKVVQSRIRIYGEKNENVMKTKHLVAMALQRLRRMTEAMEIYREVLEWQEANLAANHPSIISARLNIATCFSEEGMFAEALAIYQEKLAHLEKSLGADHPDTLATKTLLAKTLFKMGEIGQALKISEEVLIAMEKVLGAEHPETIKVRERVTFFRELNEPKAEDLK